MVAITSDDIVGSAIRQYKLQYWNKLTGWNRPKGFLTERSHEETYKLLLLAKTPSDVDNAIGVKGWADNNCHECGRTVDIVIEIGELPHDESNTARICLDCLNKAVRLAEKTRECRK